MGRGTQLRTPQEIINGSRMSVLQVTAVTMCVMLNALDGFDVLAISFASPGISSDWGIERAALGVVLSMELIGMAVGSLVIGNLADNLGRRPTILLCLVIMAAGMYAAATASDVVELSIYRLATGLGIGGMLAAINAMTAEYSNEKYRALAVVIMAGGYPFGAIVGGAYASELLVSFDWRAVFYFGAIVTAAFIPLVWFLLPESVHYLAEKQTDNALERINKILRRMGKEECGELPSAATEVPSSSVKELFSEGLRTKTSLLTVAYFAHIMTFYFIIKWIPKLVADMGYHPSEAGGVLVWANVGGLTGSILVGLLSQRFPLRGLVLTALVGSVAMVAYFGTGHDDLTSLAFFAGAAGFFTNGTIVGMYGLFALTFPTQVRAGGTGFVIGVGRGGAALGPIVAGFLFAASYGLGTVSLTMALGSLIAVIAIFLLKGDQVGGRT